MRKLSLCLVAAAALMVPIAALAEEPAPAPSTIASQICKQEQVTLKADFAKTYGTNASKSNAFGKCVSKNAKAAGQALASAASSCKSEQAADPAAFAKKYGTNGGKGAGAAKNAYGKCVSAQAKTAAQARAAKAPNAARRCKADAKADAAAFAAKYGSGKDAFGRCVAAATP
jgi:hypothetical protein